MRSAVFLRLTTGVGLASLLGRLASLVIGITLARWLGPEGYGTYAFVMAIVTLLMIVAAFGFPSLVLRDVAASSAGVMGGSARRLFVSAATIVLVLSLAITLIAELIVQALVPLDNLGLAQALRVGLWILVPFALLQVAVSAVRALHRAVQAQFLQDVAPALITLAVLGILVATSNGAGSPEGALWARLFGTLVALAFALFVALRAITPARTSGLTYDKQSARQMLRAALPFVLIAGANIVLSRTDVIMLGAMADQRAVGLYNAAAQGALMVQFVLEIANNVAAPEFSRLHAISNKYGLQRLAVMSARFVTVGALILTLPLVLLSAEILETLFGETFGEAAAALEILAVGHLISAIFGSPGFLLNMTNHHNTSLRIVISIATLNIVLNAVLIPPYGTVGAAISTGGSLVLWKYIAYRAVRHRLGIKTAAFSRIENQP